MREAGRCYECEAKAYMWDWMGTGNIKNRMGLAVMIAMQSFAPKILADLRSIVSWSKTLRRTRLLWNIR